MAYALASESIVSRIEDITAQFKLCQNRVWEIARSLDPKKRVKLLDIASNIQKEQAGEHKNHDQCTFDFCEHSRLDFTGISQRHECRKELCDTRIFKADILEDALNKGNLTAWALDGQSTVQRPESFMAISHVWSDGTGSGAWQPGQVNTCLYDFFMKIAQRFHCDGIWWDTICIPKGKVARSKAINNMQRNYEDARVTLVHDGFLRNWEWVDAEIACFAITISPWFSRGWTALELATSRKVKIIFKGGVIKDLDEDILAKSGSKVTPNHQIVSQIIEGLRNRRVANVNQLLRVLGPRHTSWPRDVAIISGQLVGVSIKPTQQAIYQSVLKKIGQISHENLFHNSVTMSNEFTWCPTNLFDLPQSSLGESLSVKNNGDVVGKWDIFRILDHSGEILKERYNWQSVHHLVEAKLQASLKRRGEHLFLVNPNDGDQILAALLVKVPGRDLMSRVVQFVGPVYFHPPLSRTEHYMGQCQMEEVTIVGAIHDSGANRTSPVTKKVDLLAAATDGDVEKIISLLPPNGEEIILDKDENSPLHLAALNGHIGAVEALIRQFSPGRINKFKGTELHLAAQNGHGNIVELIVHHGIDPNVEDMHTWTPLHYAVWNCDEIVVQKLLDAPHGANWFYKDRLGQTTFHLAAERGNVKIVKSLLQRGADVTNKCNDEQTVIHRAAWGGSTKVMMELLQEWTGYTAILDSIDKDGRTALHIAAEQGHAPIVQLLLEGSAKPDIQDNMEQTPLHLAAQNGHLEVAVQLVQGTELEQEDANGLTPLLLAIKNGHAGVVEMLIDSGSDFESSGGSGRTPLTWAAANGHKDVVRLLMKAGVDVTRLDGDGQTPMLAAAENGHSAVVEVLLERHERGTSLEFKVSGGRTPLLWAAEKGHHETVELLIKRGANIETRDSKNQTPLIVAAMNGHEAVVTLLLQQPHIQLEAKDDSGMTALACATGSEAVAKTLLKHGAFVDTMDNYKRTPLDRSSPAVTNVLLEHGASLKYVDSEKMLLRAAGNGDVETARLLIKNGTNINCRQKDDARTPIMVAIYHDHTEMVKMLLNNKANVEVKDNRNQTPLWQAAGEQFKDQEVLLGLLKAGARLMSAEQGGHLLLWALEKGHDEIAKLVLDQGANPNYTESTGEYKTTPLEHAAGRNDVKMMRLLFKKGAKATAYGDGDKNGPLMAALHQSTPATDAIELLLDKGVKIPLGSLSNSLHVDLLEKAVKNGNGRLVKRLLKSGVQVENKNSNWGRTPLSWAVEMGHVEMAKDLLKYGANTEAADGSGQTPLFFASGSIQAVRLLLNKGADPGARDIHGRSPLSRAIAHGHKEAVKLLSGMTV